MSLNSILNIGTSGLSAAQNQLHVISDNVANLNTTGYIRKTLSQKNINVNGVGAGVSTGQVSLVSNQYLEQASLKASSNASQFAAYSELIDNIQSRFGDITSNGSVLNLANSALSSLAQLSENPTSSPQKQTVLSNIESFFTEAARVSDQIQAVRQDADSRILADINAINDILKNITTLNSSISSSKVSGYDSSSTQTELKQNLDRLAKLVDIETQQNSNGSTTVRTHSGLLLADQTAATLSYIPKGYADAGSEYGAITIVGSNGAVRDFSENVSSGELKGLIDIRDKDAPAISAQLSQYVASFAQTLNAAHNEATSLPPPASLTGKNTSQTLSEALSGFSGTTHMMITDQAGLLQKKVDINFSTHTYYVDGSATGTAFTDASFASDITTALGGLGSVSFANGALSLNALGAGNGVALINDPSSASSKSSQSFAQYFGLNDLISSGVPLNYDTGLGLASNHGFVAGESISFSLTSGNGGHLANIDVTIPAATDMNSLINALNNVTTGVGRFGSFALDSKGKLSFTGYGTPQTSLNITADSTKRNTNGASLSNFFGLGNRPNLRATSLSINAAIKADTNRLGTKMVSLTATSGKPALLRGDGSGADLMAKIGSKSINIDKSGFSNGGLTTLLQYGADLVGQAGGLASSSQSRLEAAQSLFSEVDARLQSYEGVNLDEELLNMTTFQQAYSASSRIIQAAKDMYDVLLNMV